MRGLGVGGLNTVQLRCLHRLRQTVLIGLKLPDCLRLLDEDLIQLLILSLKMSNVGFEPGQTFCGFVVHE